MSDTTSLLLLCGIVFLAFWLGSLTGFGSTIFTLSLGAHLYPIDELLPIFAPVNLGLALYLVSRNRKHIETSFLLYRILPWMLAGFVVGFLLFLYWGKNPLLPRIYAGFVVLLAAAELYRWRSSSKPVPLASYLESGLLITSGVIHGLFSSGGPLLVYCTSRRIPDKRNFRGTMGAVWMVMGSLLVAGYSVEGYLDGESLSKSVFLLAPLAVGITVGEWCHTRVDAHRFRGIVYLLLCMVGLLLLLRNSQPSGVSVSEDF